MTDSSAPDGGSWLGREVTERFQPPHARRRTRLAPERRAGMVAAKSAKFGYLNGRSILARRMLGQNVSARVSGTDLLPVGMQLDLWLAIAERERERMRPSPSQLEQNMQAAQRRMIQRSAPRGFAAEAAAAGPRGLPRATSRGRLSPAGVDTGPSSASHRMVTEAAFVANPEEVRAAGPMLGRRDLARAVARRSTVGPPSPSTGGGRARRSAQASGPGRQVGATRPSGDPTATPSTPSPSTPSPIANGVAKDGGSPSAESILRAASMPAGTGVADARTVPSLAPRAISLPPRDFIGAHVATTESMQWQPLPRPGAVARRGALAAQLRRMPRQIPHAVARVNVNTGALAVAPSIEATAAGVAAINRRAFDAAAAVQTSVSRTATPSTATPSTATPSTATPSTATPSTAVPRAPASRTGGATPSTGVNPHVDSVTSVPTSREGQWSLTATTAGDFPVSLFGPAAPSHLLRARVLGAAPAAAVVSRAGIVRRALTTMSPRWRRPSMVATGPTFAAPMVSTVDRHLTAAASTQSLRSAGSPPALRSLSDAVQRASRSTDVGLPSGSPMFSTPARSADVSSTAGRIGAPMVPAASIAPIAPIASTASIGLIASTPSVSGATAPSARRVVSPSLVQVRAAESAAVIPMRHAESPVPSLPLAAAFLRRAAVVHSQEMLPIAARSRFAAASSRPTGRVSMMAAAHAAPIARRTRFGSAIAPTTAAPFVFAVSAPQRRVADTATSPLMVSVPGVRHELQRSVAGSQSPASPSPALPRTAGVSMTAGVPTTSGVPTLGAPMTPVASMTSGVPSAPGMSRPSAVPMQPGSMTAAMSMSSEPLAGPVVPVSRATVAPPVSGLATSSAGARFLAALHERPADPVRAVPAKYMPLARAIAGPRPVAVRSGPSTSRALRKAGKQAATVGNIVHLASSPGTASLSTEVFAHELVHAARPSPIPRFFDDDHHSPEEDLARATGNLMRVLAPPAMAGPQMMADPVRRAMPDSRTPTFGTAGLVVGASGGLMSALAGASPSSPAAKRADSTIRRSPAARPAAERRKARTTESAPAPSGSTPNSSSSSSSLPAQSPARQNETIFRSRSIGGGSSIVRRESALTQEAPSNPFGSSMARSMGVTPSETGSAGFAGGMQGLMEAAGYPTQTGEHVDRSNSPFENEMIERIIDAIEERVIAELERRGRRHHPGVF